MTPSVPNRRDSKKERARRQALLVGPQAQYVYAAKSKNVLAPVAMAARVPPGQNFADQPEWVLLVAQRVTALAINAVEVLSDGGRGAGRERHLQTLNALHDVVRQLMKQPAPQPKTFSTGLLGELEEAAEGFVHTIGARLAHLGGATGSWSVIERLIRQHIDAILEDEDLRGRPTKLKQFADQFESIALPEGAGFMLPPDPLGDDAHFAQLRVAGPNPMVIKRADDASLKRLKADAGKIDAQLDGGDTLAAARADGRAFVCDYHAIRNVEAASGDDGQKFLTAPVALFIVRPGEHGTRAMQAVAIRPDPKGQGPTFYPGDGTAWLLSKLAVEVADATYHELISHLGRTHLVIEAFAMATARQLDREHPLNILLSPHFVGTLAINDAAAGALISDGGAVAQLSSGKIADLRKLAATHVVGWNLNAGMLEHDLRSRGVDDVDALPYFPYRDDARLVWDAISGFVADYIALYYEDDRAVSGDYELQAWLQELISSDAAGGHLLKEGLGQTAPKGERRVRTRTYLRDLVTMVIFTASAQHAAVNFPQRGIMSFTPTMPLSSYRAPPRGPIRKDDEDAVLEAMPPLQIAFLQLNVGQALGGIYYTQLGGYSDHHFGDGRVFPLLAQYRDRLQKVEIEINARNTTRPRYPYLLPSQIPQSINI